MRPAPSRPMLMQGHFAGSRDGRREGVDLGCDRGNTRMKVLIVEDDLETVDYVANGLAELGHQVQISRDGRDGLFRATAEIL